LSSLLPFQQQYIRNMAATGTDGTSIYYSSAVSSIFDGHGAVASVILDRTALSVDQQGVTGNSLLMWAAYFGQTAVVQDLIKRGANAALVNVDGDTAITLARKQGHFDVATLLLAYSGNG